MVALALGTPLRGDDGTGPAIAEGLSMTIPGLEVIEAAELLPEHAEAVAKADGAFFLDASAVGAPGEVRAQLLLPRSAGAALLHALTPEEVLGLARALFGRAPPAALVTIAGKDFAFGEGLSAEVRRSLPEARQRVKELAESFTRSDPNDVRLSREP
ncbi:MAG TPA: hydrogenase maturation protease [Anaeromyxobacter sp.]|nr:hydrogenase maturation protease [Anaeromyxobacter sp.]